MSVLFIASFLSRYLSVSLSLPCLPLIRYGRLAPTAVATARQKHKSSSSSAANVAIARALLIAALPDLEAYNAEIEWLAAQKAATNSNRGSSSGVASEAAKNTVKADAVVRAQAAIKAAEGNEAAFKDLLGNVAAVEVSF